MYGCTVAAVTYIINIIDIKFEMIIDYLYIIEFLQISVITFS